MVKLYKYEFENREAIFKKLHHDVLESLKEGLSEYGVASMALSGGTTPGPLYQKMSESDFDWEKVIFTLTDERWVEPDHPDSNERLVKNTLLKNKAEKAEFIGLKSEGEKPCYGVVETEKKLANFPLPADVVLLGMGEDGHTASLFPGVEDTIAALNIDSENLCHSISRGIDEVDRITLTLKCLLEAKKVYLVFFGQKKMDVFKKAEEEKTDQLPVSYILHQDKVPISIYWAE